MKPLHYLLFGIILFLLLVSESLLSASFIFISKSLFLTIYLLFEIYYQKKREPEKWFINPAVLASVFTFIIGFGITNLLFLNPDSYFSNSLYNKLGAYPFEILNKAMTSVILASICMWAGYKTKIGVTFFHLITKKIINLNNYLKQTFNLNYFIIYIFIVLSIIARVYSISLGIFGYAQSPEQFDESAGIAQILHYAGLLGAFSLLLISLSYYSNQRNIKLKIMFFTIVSIELIFGIMSGMKSMVVLPVFIPFVCYLIINNRFNKRLILVTIIMLVMAYTIIEPFRILRNIDRGFKSDPFYIINTMIDAYELNKQRNLANQLDKDIFVYSVLSRNNYILDAAKAIDYKEEIGLTKGDPDFVFRLYSFPLQTFVPRMFWRDKPKENIGLWFTQKVWGYPFYSSTAMTPIGFLYFAGGNILIAIVFFIIGIVQRALVKFLKAGAGGIIIFLGFLGSVVLIDSAVNTIFVNWVRNFPILVFLQYISLKR